MFQRTIFGTFLVWAVFLDFPPKNGFGEHQEKP